MATILLAAVPTPGHMNPLITIGTWLTVHHSVLFYTPSCFSEAVIAAGMTPIHDDSTRFDYRAVEHSSVDWNAESDSDYNTAQFINAMIDHDLINQFNQLVTVIAEQKVDLMIFDNMFYTASLLLNETARYIPPVMIIGVTPLPCSAPDSHYWGARLPPEITDSLFGKLSLRQIRVQQRIAETESKLQRVCHQLDQPLISGHYNDFLLHQADAWLHLSVREFEFIPRILPENIKFIGPLPVTGRGCTPDNMIRWPVRYQSLPLVIVTQGTLDTADFSALIEPCLRLLKKKPVRVLAVTGRRPATDIKIALSDNVCVAEYIDLSVWLPQTCLLVAYGGYGIVNIALKYGVPVLGVSDGEGKAETLCRLLWSRCGLALFSRTPDEEELMQALNKILTEQHYMLYSGVMQTLYQRCNPQAAVLDTVQLLTEKTAKSAPELPSEV